MMKLEGIKEFYIDCGNLIKKHQFYGNFKYAGKEYYFDKYDFEDYYIIDSDKIYINKKYPNYLIKIIESYIESEYGLRDEIIGKEIIDSIGDYIRVSATGEIYIVYINPTREDLIDLYEFEEEKVGGSLINYGNRIYCRYVVNADSKEFFVWNGRATHSSIFRFPSDLYSFKGSIYLKKEYDNFSFEMDSIAIEDVCIFKDLLKRDMDWLFNRYKIDYNSYIRCVKRIVKESGISFSEFIKMEENPFQEELDLRRKFHNEKSGKAKKFFERLREENKERLFKSK